MTHRDRLESVERLLVAAKKVHAERETWVTEIARATGLTPEGVRAGFSCLERAAPPEALHALVCRAREARHVHVIMSSNVFVAPLRALALARAAGGRVTIRPSPRDPILTTALLAALDDDAVAATDVRDVARVGADEVHVYGTRETISAVRASTPEGVVVVGHGPGFGAAIVTSAADMDRAAADLASDVALFDQRGCLSPRLVLVIGDVARSQALARALHAALGTLDRIAPRGSLTQVETESRRRWLDALTFAGEVESGVGHSVAWIPSDVPLVLGPPGRNIAVAPVRAPELAAERLAPMARHLVAIGTDAIGVVRPFCPEHARVSSLGSMQHPLLDGPVDRRPSD